jgi:hypothetical protein
MALCMMIPFRRVGVFMLVSIGFSTATSLVLFPVSLALWGPTGTTGRLACLDRLYRRLSDVTDAGLVALDRGVARLDRISRCARLLRKRVVRTRTA